MTMLSRRELLAAGALAIPCLAGAGAVMQRALAAEPSDAPAPATGPATPAQEPAPVQVVQDPASRNWGFVVDTRNCIGCGLCVEACKDENDVPREAEYNRTWIERHTVTTSGQVFIESPEGGAAGFPAEPVTYAPIEGKVSESLFVPRLCMQCQNPPCVSICPVSATYRTADGVVLVDQDKCIGCGYCVVSCPYGARYLVPSGGDSPTGNAGVADKCTWCYHRITKGGLPACVEICPTRARNFGDLDDPESSVSKLMNEELTTSPRQSEGTRPRVRYIGLPAGEL
ncbi:MAG: 4Fe-4S dicluster domain-containing protein [Chloroflexota bacterium]